jgi:LysM repeat protein
MKTRRTLIWGTIGLVVVLAVAGCTCERKALPDVEPTAVGAQDAPPDDGMPDATAIFQTAQANSATAQAASGQDATAEPTAVPDVAPTEPPPTEAPSPTDVPATEVPPTSAPAPTAAPSSGTTTYTVQRGDTLYSIARRYGSTVEAIAAANSIANPSLIRVGQTLTIPGGTGVPVPVPSGGTTYVVQRGDNLFRIALRYGISYVYLAQYNGIADPSRIYVGQVIKIPPQ